jgi:hypothetical protein
MARGCMRLLAAAAVLVLAAALGSRAAAHEPAVRGRQHQTSLHHSALAGNASTLLGPILSWPFSLPEDRLRRGVVYTGGGAAGQGRGT